MQPLAVQTGSDVAVSWRRQKPPRVELPPRPDAQNVLTRLDAVVDRLEGAYGQLDRLVPLLEQYADALADEQRGGE